MIRFACPHCGKQFSGADELAGRQANCNKCGKLFTVGESPPAPARPSASQPARVQTPQPRRPASTPSVVVRPTPARRMHEEQKAWTVDNSTRASNPGKLRVNRLRWFRHYPKWPIIWFSSLAFSVALACWVHGSFWVLAVLLCLMNWLYWLKLRDHFMYGCTNPAVIVSLDPMLIAVSTDLTKGTGTYPVIKIIKKSLPTACGQLPQVGSYLPAVALYSGSPDDVPHWSDFDPRPIDCATGDIDAMQRVMSTISQEDWHELHVGLKQVPRPFRCGLYPIEPSE